MKLIVKIILILIWMIPELIYQLFKKEPSKFGMWIYELDEN